MTTATTQWTAERLFAAGDIGRCELVKGKLVMMSPAGANHGRIVSRIDRRLGRFVEQQRLGEVFGAETGFVIGRNPDTVRAPDVAFVHRSRVQFILPEGYFPGAPDLAVEVLSPSDSAIEAMTKVQEWLAAGTKAVWVVDPANRTIVVHRPDAAMKVYRGDDSLTDESLLPGFALVVKEVFG